MCNLGHIGVLIIELFCSFNTKPYYSDMCVYHRSRQTRAEICRHMGICCGFRVVAVREKYPGFILLFPEMRVILQLLVASVLCTHLLTHAFLQLPNTFPQMSLSYLVNTVDTDGLVCKHQGINSYSACYTLICLQMIMC